MSCWRLANEHTLVPLIPSWTTNKQLQPSDILRFYSTVQTKTANSDSHMITSFTARWEQSCSCWPSVTHFGENERCPLHKSILIRWSGFWIVLRASKLPAEWDLLCSRWSLWEYDDSTGLRCTELTVASAKGGKENKKPMGRAIIFTKFKSTSSIIFKSKWAKER